MDGWIVRKRTRLKDYDYSQAGCYFVTICVKDMLERLGIVVVGDGVLDVPCVQLFKYGEITEKHIVAINTHYSNLSVVKHVVMPNHVHMIISIGEGVDDKRGKSIKRTSPANATIPALISSLKRFIHKECGFILFQRSYHDHIIRNDAEYKDIAEYIDNNPLRWKEDCFYPR